jgi:hypothetical protein
MDDTQKKTVRKWAIVGSVGVGVALLIALSAFLYYLAPGGKPGMTTYTQKDFSRRR